MGANINEVPAGQSMQELLKFGYPEIVIRRTHVKNLCVDLRGDMWIHHNAPIREMPPGWANPSSWVRVCFDPSPAEIFLSRSLVTRWDKVKLVGDPNPSEWVRFAGFI